jgi:hypothetical protein
VRPFRKRKGKPDLEGRDLYSRRTLSNTCEVTGELEKPKEFTAEKDWGREEGGARLEGTEGRESVAKDSPGAGASATTDKVAISERSNSVGSLSRARVDNSFSEWTRVWLVVFSSDDRDKSFSGLPEDFFAEDDLEEDVLMLPCKLLVEVVRLNSEGFERSE